MAELQQEPETVGELQVAVVSSTTQSAPQQEPEYISITFEEAEAEDVGDDQLPTSNSTDIGDAFRAVDGWGAVKPGTTAQHPMQIVVDFVRKKQIRLLELFRSMDKTVLFKMTDKAFIERLKRFGMPLSENQLGGLTKAISKKGTDKSEITYPKLVRSVADHILQERAMKSAESSPNMRIGGKADVYPLRKGKINLPRLTNTPVRQKGLRKILA